MEDIHLLAMAIERLKNADPATYLSLEEIESYFGISEDDLNSIDDVELE